MPKLRLGVALLVPPPFDREVDALRRAMGDPALGRIPPHLTLVPPVNVREDAVGDAVGVLRAAAAATRPFTVELGPVATFLPVNPVLFLDVRGDVDAVHALRDRVFRPPLERSLTWPFTPHVTVADDAEPARIEAASHALRDYRRAVTLDRVHLLQEHEGRVWKPIGEWAFGAAAVVGRGGLELEITEGMDDPEAQAFAEREWSLHDTTTFGQPYSRTSIGLTARRDGEVIGIAVGFVGGERAHLSELIVAAAARGEGIGAHLLAAFESRVAAMGASFMTLSTLRDGPAEAFYEAHGWRRTTVMEREQHGRDFVRMQRDL